MKKIVYTVLISSALACTTVKAEEQLPSPVIAVVEQATLDRSDAVKSIRSQVEKKQGEVKNEMSKYEKELKAEDSKLAEEQKKLPEKQFAEKRQKFERRVQEVQEKLELRRLQIEYGVEEARQKVIEAFRKVSAEVKNDVGANIVLLKDAVVTSDSAFDISSQVLDRLNKELPSVQVTYKSESEIKQELLKQAQIQ